MRAKPAWAAPLVLFAAARVRVSWARRKCGAPRTAAWRNEVIGNLRPGDMVVRRATDELREGAALPATAK